jgi:hypothetical protein
LMGIGLVKMNLILHLNSWEMKPVIVFYVL